MRVLIDECIDERFRNSLPRLDCQTVRYAGLAGLKNGELLVAAATAKFDVSLRSIHRISAKFNRPKHRNYHFSHEIKPPEGPLAARTRLPRLHCTHSTWSDC
jgi:hypothetical protein